MFVKITSNRTNKTVCTCINLEISDIKVVDESLINFTDTLYVIFYHCCKLYTMRHVVFNPKLEIIVHKSKIIKIDIASQTYPTAKSIFETIQQLRKL